MRIGIDLRALQTGHKYRGIGEVAKQVTNRIIELGLVHGTNEFVFYEYEDDDPKQLLDLPQTLRYSVVKQGFMPEQNLNRTKQEKVSDAARSLYGNPVRGGSRSDVFLQFDYAFGVPKHTRTLLIMHDIIPTIFWNQYFESAWVPFKNYAARTTLRTLFANYKYEHVLRRSVKNAKKIITVSDSTKRDIERYLHVNRKKIRTVPLGVDARIAKTDTRIITGSDTVPTKPFLLFIGAGDARRRVDDLVAAYNNLKAKGNDIQLVLVGENFQQAEKIPNKITRQAVLDSSYGDDILTLGYVDDVTKQRLYKDAIAFVYPTLYEGFGIPVLESMLLSCPIITYRNSSIPEVAGNYALYAHNWQDIVRQVQSLLGLSQDQRAQFVTRAKQYAQGFTWDKTAAAINDELTKL